MIDDYASRGSMFSVDFHFRPEEKQQFCSRRQRWEVHMLTLNAVSGLRHCRSPVRQLQEAPVEWPLMPSHRLR